MFDRIHPLEGEFRTGWVMGYYQTKLDAGYDTIAVDESSISSSGSSVCSDDTHFLDIFGDPDCKEDNVHLMPASPGNAEQWSVIVPGVLSSIVRERTDKMNCFIHGFRKATSPNDSLKKNSRVDKSGIKHFATNMIRLKGQCHQHYDRNHCVLIIPILSCREIKEWSGNGYDAIVLADGNNMYRKIGADTDAMSKLDTSILANAVDIETCRTVLTDLIRIVFQSFNTNAKLEERIDFSRLKIPLAIDSNTFPKVRKIHFSSRIGCRENHPRAPDPMLLLSKAVSNWLHSHGLMNILPVPPLIENEESTVDSGSQNSYYCGENSFRMKSNFFDLNSAGSSRHLADSQFRVPVVDIAFVNDDDSSVSLCSDMHGVADSTMVNAYNGIPYRSISPYSITSD